MKKLLVIILFFSPVALVAQGDFTIQGKVKGVPGKFKKAYLGYETGKGFITDSVVMKQGVFSFSGTIYGADAQYANLYAGNNAGAGYNNSLRLFVKNGDHIVINETDSFTHAVFTGSIESEDYNEAVRKLSATSLPDSSVELLKKLIAKYPDSKMPYFALQNRFGAQNNLAQQYPKQVAAIIELFNMFSARIRATEEGIAYGQSLERFSHLVPGGTLPEFAAQTPDGKTVKLSDFRGKYVLVDFWASWCIPCRREFSYLKKAYSRFKSKNFEIIGYSIDEDMSLWASAIENDDLQWINVSTLTGGYKDPAALAYEIHGIPANFLVDPIGKVIAVNLREEQVEPILDQFIK